ncbi:MAG: pyridoxal-phosphate dependent enzyme, partial [Planctomycetaceae bacterium]|nr:pyridoxal-phosphate dependent enzyme [Planctomycetaceae bacterium]
MSLTIATIQDVRAAEKVIRQHLSPTPLIRSYRLEKELGLAYGRQVWLKDYGWSPTGSFKVMGALNWMAQNLERIGDRPVAAHSSGNFASGISYAGMRYGKKVIIVMPDSAPKVKFDLTRSFGAEIRTYDIEADNETTRIRDKITQAIVVDEGGIQAYPYDHNDVISGNGVGALEIVEELKRQGRTVSHFLCPVSGGGLMSGQALAIADGFPEA